MNVYEKLNLARVKFQSSNVRMSGLNDYAGYGYYDLSDILPKVNEICSEIKCTCVVSFDNQIARLDFIDCEKPDDKITFTSPMSEASLRGCHAVQNLGAVETYLKRYLYQHCFEIVEHDELDKTMNPNENKQSENKKTTSTTKNNTHSNTANNANNNNNGNNKRIAEISLLLEEYISAGILSGDFKKKAEFNMQKRDLDALEKTLAWCKTQASA